MHAQADAGIERLSDDELRDHLVARAARARAATAGLVEHLAEVDRRSLHLQQGYGSLFVYCREVLALSEQEAFDRVGAARAVRAFPVILDLLADGSITLTAARLLGPYLTAENHREVLERARGRRRAEVEEMVARLAPREDQAWEVAKLPARTTPLAPDRYRLQMTIGPATLDKLRLARDMLSHRVPDRDDAVVLDRALSVLLALLARERYAAAARPRGEQDPTPGSRHIPAQVKRAVWQRDEGACAFLGEGGRRCAERAFLEFHHVVPFAEGGPPTVGNIELRCRQHNEHESRVHLGRG